MFLVLRWIALSLADEIKVDPENLLEYDWSMFLVLCWTGLSLADEMKVDPENLLEYDKPREVTKLPNGVLF